MIHGMINVYKERGFTSHDVVAKLRGILRQKKIGHTGTLDPEAEGVLPVCLGVGTRLADMLTDTDKTYRAVMLLGKTTDTQDTTGTVLRECGRLPSEEEIRAAAIQFTGDYAQIPPMYSALKVNGKKLYELAREGKTVERAARPVRIYGIKIERIDLPRVTMTVTCSKGTYIRTLCHDIGETLGCGGCMEELTRLRAGVFSIENSLKLSDIEALQKEGRILEAVTPVDAMFPEAPAVRTTAAGDKYLYNGNELAREMLAEDTPGGEAALAGALPGDVPRGKAALAGALPGDTPGGKAASAGTLPGDVPRGEARACVRVYDSRGNFCGLYRTDEKTRRCRPVKMFLTANQE